MDINELTKPPSSLASCGRSSEQRGRMYNPWSILPSLHWVAVDINLRSSSPVYRGIYSCHSSFTFRVSLSILCLWDESVGHSLALISLPVVSVLLARLTVFPNKQYRGTRFPITPETTCWMEIIVAEVELHGEKTHHKVSHMRPRFSSSGHVRRPVDSTRNEIFL